MRFRLDTGHFFSVVTPILRARASVTGLLRQQEISLRKTWVALERHLLMRATPSFGVLLMCHTIIKYLESRRNGQLFFGATTQGPMSLRVVIWY